MPRGRMNEPRPVVCAHCGSSFLTDALRPKFCHGPACDLDRKPARPTTRRARAHKGISRSTAREFEEELSVLAAIIPDATPSKRAFREAMVLVSNGRDPHFAYLRLAALCVVAASHKRRVQLDA